MQKKIKVAVVGTGSFSHHFIPLFQAHPDVEEVVLSDIDADKLKQCADKYNLSRTLPSLDEVCNSDVDCVALFTQNWMHGPQAVQALNAGKHVYSAVPSGVSLEEMEAMLQAATAAKRIYMVGETSYYYPHVIYCRQKYKEGAFGDIVYGEAEYYHDFDSLYEVLQWRGGKDWLKTAGSPPMYYPTHSISQIVSVTGARMTKVSCQGFVDRVDDQVFKADTNMWSNEFSNQTALFQMSDGSSCRINEFRRIGHPGGERMNLYGTEGSFEGNMAGAVWYDKQNGVNTSLQKLLHAPAIKPDLPREQLEGMDRLENDSIHYGTAPIQDLSRLPATFKGMPNGHYGAHQFLVDDFVKSCVTGILPPNNLWQAARYLVPGLIAHESALQGGKLLDIPDFGDAPDRLE